MLDSNTINFMLAISVLIFFLSLIWELYRCPSKTLIPIFIARALAIAFMFHLFGEFKTTEKQHDFKKQVVILMDDSASTSMLNSKTRDETRKIIKSINSHFSKDKRYGLTEYSFATDIIRGGRKAPSLSWTKNTALGDALLRVNSDCPGASIFLFTDGNENFGVPSLAAANRLNVTGCAINPILINSETISGVNLKLLSCHSPKTWIDNKSRYFQGTIGRDSKDIKDCELGLYIDGVKRIEKNIELTTDFQNFKLIVPSNIKIDVGWHEYRIVAKSSEKENLMLDNVAEGIFENRPSDEILIIWSAFNPDLSFLVRILRAKLGAGVKLVFKNDFAAMRLRQQVRLLSNCKRIFLGAVSPNIFQPKSIEFLERRLEKASCRLIFTHPSVLGKWLNQNNLAKFIPIASLGEKKKFSKAMKVSWKESKGGFLPIHTVQEFNPRKSAFVVLSTKSDATRKEIPILLTNRYVSCLASTGYWRWERDQRQEVRLASNLFWSSLLNINEFSKQNELSLKVDKAKLFDSDGKDYLFEVLDRDSFRTGEIFLVNLAQESDKKLDSLKFQKGSDDSGKLMSCQLEMKNPGIHWFKAVKLGPKSIVMAESERVPVFIKNHNLELSCLRDQSSKLRELAKLTGGETIGLDTSSATGALPHVKTTSIPMRVQPAPNMSNLILLGVAIILLLAFEWFLRRKYLKFTNMGI